MKNIFLYNLVLIIFLTLSIEAQTIAFWPFDEQQGIYPSCVLSDLSDNDYPLVIGPGGRIVTGKFGNALAVEDQPDIEITEVNSSVQFGLTPMDIPEGRTVEPMTWFNANFTALMTSGEKHLRNQVGFPQVTTTKLNLGDFDWTVEFWLKSESNSDEEGTVFEIGTGPRGENDLTKSLVLSGSKNYFLLFNHISNTSLIIKTALKENEWQHLAFVYDAAEDQLSHFVDGVLQPLPLKEEIKSLPAGEEDYMSIGRDGTWGNPLPGTIDELRFSEGLVYEDNFEVPASFSYLRKNEDKPEVVKGPKLMFAGTEKEVLELNSRKHLFVDDALFDTYDDELEFVVNPPRPDKMVIGNIKGAFRKHLNVLEDDEGRIRIYTTVEDDYLAVWISDDGVNFEAPRLPNGNFKKNHNVVLHSKVGMGMVFIDPNAPEEERYKYISDYHRRAVSLFYSKDGLEFKRYKQPVLPFRSGSQCNIYYDDQKQVYTAFHRSDFGRTTTGDTQRDFVMTETTDILNPWPFKPLSADETIERAEGKRVAGLIPWYLDNGPLTPGGFAMEYPWIFSPIDNFDPPESDVYVPKVMKYPWAPDTYLAFPVIYFHYEESVPVTRRILEEEKRGRGSGPLESQISVSRNGTDWQRYPRPAYVGIGEHAGIDFKTAYIAHGMIKRGNEIWQYYFGEPHYHSPWNKIPEQRSVLRLVQRLDGFVSLDSPYEQEAVAVTRPFVFKGNTLTLNIDTDAAGYAQVGFLDENNNPIEGYSVDDCIYINGDFINTEVEWMKNRSDITKISTDDDEDNTTLSSMVITSSDVSELQGKTVKLIFRMRGSKLYSMKFENKNIK